MGCSCKGRCNQIRCIKGWHYHDGRQRYCSVCAKWIPIEYTNGLRCPCCNVLLRYHPRYNRARRKMVRLNKLTFRIDYH